jgi:ketosteroid isomerase-like protein
MKQNMPVFGAALSFIPLYAHNMTTYPAGTFQALDPFFNVIAQGLTGLVDGGHFFDTIADCAVFEFLYTTKGWPQRVDGREPLMALFSGYGKMLTLSHCDHLVVHKTQDPRVVILEYQVHGKVLRTGAAYQNNFISVITIGNRKIVHWRDYMDSHGAVLALSAGTS